MTFNPLAAMAVQELLPQGAVCELGNQRFTASGPHKSTADFYKSLGFESYLALDVNTEMGAKVVDLNRPIRNHHYDLMGKFDLVTNNGTGEHIFNQDAVFENVHDLCRVGGAMLHILPLGPWVNHGFYNYNPILFRDLAAANGYEWLFFWLADRWGNKVEITEEDFGEAFKEKRPKALVNAIKQVTDHSGYDCSIVVCWRKVHDSRFRRPFQGKYLQDIADTSVKATYGG